MSKKMLGDLMKQAQKMQQEMGKVQEESKKKTVEASSGGGMVVVVANGAQEIISIKIEKDVVNPEDIDMLQDLITAAVNEALRMAQPPPIGSKLVELFRLRRDSLDGVPLKPEKGLPISSGELLRADLGDLLGDAVQLVDLRAQLGPAAEQTSVSIQVLHVPARVGHVAALVLRGDVGQLRR